MCSTARLNTVLKQSVDDVCLSVMWAGCLDGSVQVRSFVTGLHCQHLEGHRSEVQYLFIDQSVTEEVVLTG